MRLLAEASIRSSQLLIRSYFASRSPVLTILRTTDKITTVHRRTCRTLAPPDAVPKSRTVGDRNAQFAGRHAHRSGMAGCSGPIKTAGCIPLFLVSLVVSFAYVQGRPQWAAEPRLRRTRSNRTGLNHQPQNSKAREVEASAGSNPAATAKLTRETPVLS